MRLYPTITWNQSVSSPILTQEDQVSGSNGNNLIIRSQRSKNSSGDNGGAIILSGGDGYSTAGNSGVGGSVSLRVGTGVTGGNIYFQVGQTNQVGTVMTFTPSNTGVGTNTWSTSSGITQVLHNYANSSTALTGGSITIQGQNTTAGSSTGGQVVLTSGTGTTAAGSVVIQAGGTTQVTVATNAVTIGAATTSVNVFNGSNRFTTRTVSGNVTIDTTTTDAILFVDTSAARSITLPAPTNGRLLLIKDITGTASTNNITLVRNGSEKIDGVAASKVFSTNWGGWHVTSNGTDWFIV